MTKARAKKIALWIGEIFPTLNADQVKEYVGMIQKYDSAIVVRSVRLYHRSNQFAILPDIRATIEAEIAKRRARAESQRRRIEHESAIEAKLDGEIAAMSLADLIELREVILAAWPRDVAERWRLRDTGTDAERRERLATSQVIRATIKAKMIAERDAQKPEPAHEQPQSDRGSTPPATV